MEGVKVKVFDSTLSTLTFERSGLCFEPEHCSEASNEDAEEEEEEEEDDDEVEEADGISKRSCLADSDSSLHVLLVSLKQRTRQKRCHQ